MSRHFRLRLGTRIGGIALALFLLACGVESGGAQQQPSQGGQATPGELHGKMLQVPVGNLVPGGITARPEIKDPVNGDAAAAQRGMRAFNAFNCVGCHMGNGGGGMGPALSNQAFIYGSEPENIYLSILQGRPYGMPAWGAVLPNEIVWDLVAYIKNISDEPQSKEWGKTLAPGSPALEQVPAELQATATPWAYTQKFSNGQKP